MTRPNFFLVGAPKCGTTALDSYLKSHPEVFVSARKELHFFGSDLKFASRPGVENYLANFQTANGKPRVGESSVWYLYSRRAADEIYAFAPHASIIVMLRNPVDLLHSLHSQMVFTAKDDIADFAEALDAEDDRKRGLRLPTVIQTHTIANYDPKIFYYREIIKFSEQLERYYRVFGRGRVHVILYDDFKRKTAEVYRHALEFLGVDPVYQPGFPVINDNKSVRQHTLQRLLHYPPKPLLTAARVLLPRGRLRAAVKSQLLRLNTARQKRRPLEPELRLRLTNEFRPEVERLSDMLGRDLSDWTTA